MKAGLKFIGAVVFLGVGSALVAWQTRARPTGFAALSEDRARVIVLDRSRQFLSRIAVPANISEAIATREVLRSRGGFVSSWEVRVDELLLYFDGDTGQLRAYYGKRTASDSSELDSDRRKLTLLEREKGWQRAENLLPLLQLPRMVRWETRDSRDQGPKSIAWVSFHFGEKPYGYSAFGQGNGVEVGLEPRTWRLTHLLITRSWTYDPPKLLVSPDRALKLARHAHGSPNAKSTIKGPKYLRPLDGTGCALADELVRQKRCRLAYAITLDTMTYYIDAETGESLGKLGH